MSFIPNHNALMGFHVIFIVLVFILILMILFIKILYGSGKLDMKELRSLKIEIPNKLIIGHLNINSRRNKFECLCDLIDGNMDIFLASESIPK